MNNIHCLDVTMKRAARSAWNFVLQKGFVIQGQSGMTVRQFLVERLGYDTAFIDESVRTIFLNSSPVDDIDSTKIKDNDRLALGSAMPGLVGIVMGRDNPYKEFRSGIACKGNEGVDDSVASVRLFLKIFSTLAVDTGEAVLARGIELKSEELLEFLERNKDNVVSADGVADIEAEPDSRVRVTVEFE